MRRFVVDEQRCCRFWGFAIDTDREQVTLRWDGPPETAHLIDQLRDYVRGDQPITAVTGLP